MNYGSSHTHTHIHTHVYTHTYLLYQDKRQKSRVRLGYEGFKIHPKWIFLLYSETESQLGSLQENVLRKTSTKNELEQVKRYEN